MTRPRFGDPDAIRAARGLERYAGQMGGVPLVILCTSPAATRQWAETRPAPCYRCMAYRPDTATGCHFTERGAQAPAPPAPPPSGGLW